MIKTDRKLPVGAVAPTPIPEGGLWKLDVDDAIWQDVGLSDDLDVIPPLWLKDDNVRTGIRHLLDYDRCCEEEVRLIEEKEGLQDWTRENWAVLSTASMSTGNALGFHNCDSNF